MVYKRIRNRWPGSDCLQYWFSLSLLVPVKHENLIYPTTNFNHRSVVSRPTMDIDAALHGPPMTVTFSSSIEVAIPAYMFANSSERIRHTLPPRAPGSNVRVRPENVSDGCAWLFVDWISRHQIWERQFGDRQPQMSDIVQACLLGNWLGAEEFARAMTELLIERFPEDEMRSVRAVCDNWGDIKDLAKLKDLVLDLCVPVFTSECESWVDRVARAAGDLPGDLMLRIIQRQGNIIQRARLGDIQPALPGELPHPIEHYLE
ncbi:hypothetical protein F5Y15DRAFT_361416 [Xylariaceae sp. FL0016]|nr:hypothetical protein F5Y15DRAFT_361416 [Xylariaceae sp. FL0016]